MLMRQQGAKATNIWTTGCEHNRGNIWQGAGVILEAMVSEYREGYMAFDAGVCAVAAILQQVTQILVFEYLSCLKQQSQSISKY